MKTKRKEKLKEKKKKRKEARFCPDSENLLKFYY